MIDPDIGVMLVISVLFFAFAALSALIFYKRHENSNTVSNIFNIAASGLGIIASTIYLLSGKGRITAAVYRSAIPDLSFVVALDKLSAFFILGLSILTMCVSIYSFGYISHYYGKRNVAAFNFLYSTFILSMFFVFTAGNTVFFFVAWEIMALLSYFLVVFESEHTEKQKAGTLYIIMTHIGTAFLLISFLMMYSYTKSFDIFGDTAAIPQRARNIMFVLFLIGFGVKAGIIPLHIWLPHAHPAAPGNISALMSGIMIKTAVYGLLRFVLVYLGVESTWWGIVLLVIGMISAVLGVAYAFIENNIKRLLAYSSIENIGIILIGLGVSFIAFAENDRAVGALALTATLFHVFNHTLFKGGLFLGAGSVYYSTHTLNMERLGGLVKKMPVTAVLMLGGALSISAIVPFNGFASEWLTLQSLFGVIKQDQAFINIISIIAVAALAIAGALAAASFVKLMGIVFLGKGRSEHAEHAVEVPACMNIGMGLLIVPCFVLGIFPTLFLKLTDGLITELAGQSSIGQLKGSFLVAEYTASATGNAISPFEMLIVLMGVILLSFAVIRLIGGKYAERRYSTWDCGFNDLNARMQYTATGFAKPVQIVLRMLFRTSRELKVKGAHRYHPEAMEYTTSTEPVFEKYVYAPISRLVKGVSRKMKFSVQTGSVHRYLMYIFITVLVLLLYNRIA